MQSTLTSRGQTVNPALIRVVPVRADPIEAFRGQGKGGGVERLLAERKKDRAASAPSAYDLGKDLFGLHAGLENLSSNRKAELAKVWAEK